MKKLNIKEFNTNILFFSILLTMIILTSACIHEPPKIYGVKSTSPSPETPWTPPARLLTEQPKAAETINLPPDFLSRTSSLTLADLVDIALRNSPKTRETWALARSSAYAYKSKTGEYYPKMGISVSLGRAEGSIANGSISYFQRSYGPRIDMTWLIFDFGGREAQVEETRQALVAADWNHNMAIEDVILSVQQVYYEYIKLKAIHVSGLSSLEEAKMSLSVANERHLAGLATIADVLQAKTALAEAKLNVEKIEGDIQTTRGVLAAAIGLPADTPYDVMIPSETISETNMTNSVEQFLKEAEIKRPDLAEARAEVTKAEAHIKKIRAGGYPSLNVSASLERIFYDNYNLYGNTYNTQLQLKIPLFNGFSLQNEILQSREEKKAVEARLHDLENLVTLQVWSSYYALKTAQQRIMTSEELLASATESYNVALARYKAGIGSILDLLSAQSSLDKARALRVGAQSDWKLALAKLTHDTGNLTPNSEELKMNISVTNEKEGKQ